MRFRLFCVILLFGLMTGSAEASSFTFEFAFPWVGTTPVWGSNATLDVTVTGPSSASAAFTLDDISDILLLTNGSRSSTTFDEEDTSGLNGQFLTTNSSSLPSLAIPGSLVAREFTDSADVQLLLFNSAGHTEIQVFDPFAGGAGLTGVGFSGPQSGTCLDCGTALTPVPEPASLFLLGTGLVVAGRRRFSNRR